MVTHPRQRQRGRVTRVWGRLPEPGPFYLESSNRDPVAAMAGRPGVADIAVGQPASDARFVLRSNAPEWARGFMTPEPCAKVARYGYLNFLTSSIGNVLTPDFWPDRRDRTRRDVWMLKVAGRLESLARELATALETSGAGRPVDPEDLGTAVFEGR